MATQCVPPAFGVSNVSNDATALTDQSHCSLQVFDQTWACTTARSSRTKAQSHTEGLFSSLQSDSDSSGKDWQEDCDSQSHFRCGVDP